MTAGALFRTILIAVAIVGYTSVARAALVGPVDPLAEPVQVMALTAPSVRAAASPVIDVAAIRSGRSALPVPLPPALLLLGTAIASLLSLRTVRRAA